MEFNPYRIIFFLLVLVNLIALKLDITTVTWCVSTLCVVGSFTLGRIDKWEG